MKISYKAMRNQEQKPLEEYKKMTYNQQPYQKYQKKEEEKKGSPPDFVGPGVAIWMNKSKEGKPYATVQLHGKQGTKVACFPYQPPQR